MDAYQATLLADAPLAYLRFGELSGTSAADASGNSRTGTYAGAVTLGQAGAIACTNNAAAYFDGASGVVTVADAAPLRLTTTGTVEAWIKIAASPNTFALIVAKSSVGTAAGIDYLIDTGASGQVVRAILSDGANLIVITGGTTMTVGVWYHIALTWDGSNVRVYVNGVSDATPVAQTLNVQATTHTVNIGANADGTAWFKGHIDELAIHTAALSANRLLAHYRAGILNTFVGSRARQVA